MIWEAGGSNKCVLQCHWAKSLKNLWQHGGSVLPHSRRILSLNPGRAVLCGVCMFSPCLRGLCPGDRVSPTFGEKNSYRLLWAQDTPTKETDFMSFTSWLDNVTCERSSGHWKMILNIFWNVKGHLFLMDTSGNVSHLNSKHLKTRWKQDTVFHWKEANTVNSHCNSPWYLCICRCTWLE